jgi:hypothetical protein
MEYSTLVALAFGAISAANIVVSWLVASRKPTKDELRKHGDRLAELDKRLGEVDQRLSILPSQDSFHQLELAVTEMKGGMKVLEAETRPIAEAVKRIENFLLSPPQSSKRTR